MSKPPRGRPGPDAEYENFLYLLAEMERAIEQGTVAWSVASAEAAHHRLEKLSTELVRIASKLRVN
jgi:hypothetical protein